MTYEKVKKTFKYRFYRFLWVKGRGISNWGGKKCIKMLEKEYKNDN